MILILTPYSFNPLHPRLEYIEKYLVKNGYEVKKYNLRCENRIVNKLNWLSLSFFQVPSFFKAIKYLWRHKKKTEIVYIQDLQYLPISILAKLFSKKVIYDTLDNNVELNFYHLSNKFTILKKLSIIKIIVTMIEKSIAQYFCNEVVVNSKALVKYFKPIKANLVYYTSPFEDKFKRIESKCEIAFLYLGAFSIDKGAEEILDFVNKNEYKFYIFGDTIKEILKKINNSNNIFYTPRISSKELSNELDNLFKQYNLIGFSMIHDVHYSYATQEANKDIDYLAMGIPLIANHRQPTKEKIEVGCGVFIEDKNNIEKLLNSREFYQEISDNCINYYNKYYAQNIFEKKLLKVVRNV